MLLDDRIVKLARKLLGGVGLAKDPGSRFKPRSA